MKLLLIALAVLPVFALAVGKSTKALPTTNMIEELNPFDPNIEETLKEYDKMYEAETGLSPFTSDAFSLNLFATGCYQMNCQVYAQIVKETQKLYLYINGQMTAVWDVSTGSPGHETPLLNEHPNGRIYTKYTSTKYPEGDYNGLGNMPYAIFIRGGFAIHGTPKGNWKKLGQKASHGCIRIHPDNAKYLNELVRSVGIKNVWVSVQN